MRNEWKLAIGGAIGVPAIAYGIASIQNLFLPPLESPTPGKKHIACVGDSITYGYGVVMNRKTDAYPYILQKYVGDEWEVLNYGFSSRTLQDEGDFPYRKEKMYRRSLDAKADIYTIMLGTNDTKSWNWNPERLEQEYEAFVKEYIDIAGAENVFLVKPPRAHTLLGIHMYGIRDEQITEFCPMIDRIAEKLKTPVIDLNTLSTGHKEWLPDGIHPNRKGNIAFARAIYEKISIRL